MEQSRIEMVKKKKNLEVEIWMGESAQKNFHPLSYLSREIYFE